MKYEILDVDALGRIGKLEVNKKEMITPNLFPVVHPFKNVITPSSLKRFGAQCIFTNAYIIYQKKTFMEEIKKKQLHQFLNFDGLIATDSGAFQQYMYNDSEFNVSAEEIEIFQEEIGSDFPVILDLPVQPDDDYETAKNKVQSTIGRARNNIKRRTNTKCEWIGPIHGARFQDLLVNCAKEMSKLDFGIYAIGGLVKSFLDYRFDLTLQILLNVKKNIIPNKPLHMFGLGLPQFFSLAVACGCDLMDSAAYVLYAKENRYFTLSTGTKQLEEIDEFPCHCPICTEYDPKEMKSFEENLRIELLAKHNLFLSFSELRTIRQAIREGNLWELVEQRIRSHPNLVDAAKILRKEGSDFELYEKIYKKHGRLFTSSVSIQRPLISRYQERIMNNYRVPNEAKYLIILPELDARGQNSPTIQTWVNEITNSTLVPREELHILFSTLFFGIIPFELIDTYPLGQYEAINFLDNDDINYQAIQIKSEIFLKSIYNHYNKCVMLIPERYINQFGEDEPFNQNALIQGLDSILKSLFQSNYKTSDNLSNLLQFFKDG